MSTSVVEQFFTDEEQSDIMEHLLDIASDVDPDTLALYTEISDWQVDGLGIVRQWAAGICCRLGHAKRAICGEVQGTYAQPYWE